MSDVGGTSKQYIHVPATKTCTSSLNVKGMLLVGGLGYVLWRTFMLEERVNDLSVLLKRRGQGVAQPSAYKTQVDAHRREANPKEDDAHRLGATPEEYETSDAETEDQNGPGDAPESESEDDDVRIEEQPQEIPSQTVPESVSTPPDSMFVTTRQRRTGSELRRAGRITSQT
jgi:hypothetical protein